MTNALKLNWVGYSVVVVNLGMQWMTRKCLRASYIIPLIVFDFNIVFLILCKEDTSPKVSSKQ